MLLFDFLGTKLIGYNRMLFLLESLEDLDGQLREKGGRLLIFRGKPVDIFEKLWKLFGITKICYEQDCEPIWQQRDEGVQNLCVEKGISCVEKVVTVLKITKNRL
jgi:cryptochrome